MLFKQAEPLLSRINAGAGDRRLMVNALIFVAIVALILIAVGWMLRRGRAEYQDGAAELAEINQISMNEAERRAVSLLKDGRLFRCTESAMEVDNLASLAEGLRRLLTRYATIEVSNGSVLLDRSLLGPSVDQSEYIIIGRGMVGSDTEFELCIRNSDEPVYERYRGETIDHAFGTYSSIYHWLIAVAAELAPNEANQKRRQ